MLFVNYSKINIYYYSLNSQIFYTKKYDFKVFLNILILLDEFSLFLFIAEFISN